MRTRVSLLSVAALVFGAALPLGLAHGAALRGRLQVEPKSTLDTINITPIAEPEPGGGQIPLGLLKILSAEVSIQDSIGSSLFVTKATLTPAQAYGFGQPNGYLTPPPNNPSGPWRGLMWPFRDYNDGYAPTTSGPPLGNDVGVINSDGATSGLFRVTGITGIQAYDLMNPSSYQRGIPGNGSGIPTQFFRLEIQSTRDIQREVTITLRNLSATLLVQDENGREFTEDFTAPETTIRVIIPSPAGAGVLALGGLLAARRRRR